jgi:phage major head subunit gpT-like protein
MYQQLSLLGKKIKAAFGRIFDGEASTELQSSLALTVDSNKDKETYSFTYLFNKIREWIDRAKFDTGKTFGYEIKNKKWQSGFDIDNDYMEDVKANTELSADLKQKISGVNDDFVDHKDEILNDLLETNGNAFDETAFFANSRPNIPESTGLDNLLTGSGITLANLDTDLRAAKVALKGMRIKGKAINKNPTLVVTCPTHLTDLFQTLRASETVDLGGGAETNTLRNTFEIVENFEQDTSNNDWYLSNKTSKMQPLILQKRQDVQFKEIPDDMEDITFMNWKARYAGGYGNPMAIVKTDN